MKTHLGKCCVAAVICSGWLGIGTAFAVDGVVLITQDAALAGNVTPGDAPGFPVTLSRRGSYRLASNLRVTDPSASGIHVTASTGEVTLDLNGFTIRGPANGGLGDGVSAAVGNVAHVTIAVENGIVRDFGRYGVFIGSQSRVSKLQVLNNGTGGIYITSGFGSNVTSNIVISNGGPGIFSLGPGTVAENTLNYNAGLGIFAGGASIVKGNSVSNSGDHGLFAANGSVVVGNAVRDSVNLGMLLDGDAGYRENVLTNNNQGSANPQLQGGIPLGTNVCGSDTVCP